MFYQDLKAVKARFSLVYPVGTEVYKKEMLSIGEGLSFDDFSRNVSKLIDGLNHYSASLVSVGITAELISNLENQLADLHNIASEQEFVMKSTRKKTALRNEAMEAVYIDLVKINRTGKAIFEFTDTALYLDYITRDRSNPQTAEPDTGDAPPDEEYEEFVLS